MLDWFSFCFHPLISGILLKGVPVLIYKDIKASNCLTRKMNDECFVFVIHTLPRSIFLHHIWQWIGLCIPSLSSKSKFQRDLNHIWHQGNLIGKGKLLFCCWENYVNNERGQDHDGIMKCGIWVILTTFEDDKTFVDSSRRPQQYVILPYRKW